MSLAVFISGSGSNFQTLIDHPTQAEIKCIVTNKLSALGCYRARRSGIEVLVVGKKIDWDHLIGELKKRGVSRIMLLGFMRLVPQTLIDAFNGQIWNLHPSLLPIFPGVDSLERSFKAQAPMGVSFHQVDGSMDTGPLIFQFPLKRLLDNESELSSIRIYNSLVEQRLVRTFCERQGSIVSSI